MHTPLTPGDAGPHLAALSETIKTDLAAIESQRQALPALSKSPNSADIVRAVVILHDAHHALHDASARIMASAAQLTALQQGLAEEEAAERKRQRDAGEAAAEAAKERESLEARLQSLVTKEG